MSGATGVMDKLIGGWGVDGVTIFQSGFPLVFSNSDPELRHAVWRGFAA